LPQVDDWTVHVGISRRRVEFLLQESQVPGVEFELIVVLIGLGFFGSIRFLDAVLSIVADHGEEFQELVLVVDGFLLIKFSKINDMHEKSKYLYPYAVSKSSFEL
jgi:hypothetical protein